MLGIDGLAGLLAREAAGRTGTPDRPQREVLRLLAAGRSMKEAGKALNIAARTVAFHSTR